MRIVSWFAVIAFLALYWASLAVVAKTADTERKAAVYLAGDFSRNFNVSYQVALRPSPSNRSWTTTGLSLVSRGGPGSSIYVGLAHGPAPSGRLTAFVSANGVKMHPAFKALEVDCTTPCVLALRGDAKFVIASINAEEVAEWSRSELRFSNPRVELNAEVLKPGDQISAVFLPIRLVSNGDVMQSPSCGLSARGIKPRVLPDGVIAFSGTYSSGAPAAFVTLNTGRQVGRCASAASSARIRNVNSAAFSKLKTSAIFHAPNAIGSTRISAQTMA